MEKKEIVNKLNDINIDLDNISKLIKLDDLKIRDNELDNIMLSKDFWDDVNVAKDIIEESKNIKKEILKFDELKEKIEIFQELIEEIDEEEIKNEMNFIEKEYEKIKLDSLLNGEFDKNNAYIEIHSGAGGTESNDWANMLYRMYTRFFEKNGYTYEILSEQKGEEVGIKGITLLVKGYYPYGYLKGETGVHRLVRISPFDSNKRRHTSFASVLLTPEINKNIEVEINENDLKIDVYRSSGAGGQSVNTTDSAVRITHVPTGIVVTCQNERSQIKNKEKALEMLKNKLYLLSLEEFNNKLKSLKGDTMDVNFGSAIRSYVMCPYTLVKDTRTNYETANVEKVLDGDIAKFLEENIKVLQ